MTDEPRLTAPARPAPGRSRGRRWRRWILITVVALVALLFAGVWAYSHLPAPAPLALPPTAATTPVGELDGTWVVATGSEAGFRIEQTIFGMTSDIVGRTGTVSGTVVIAGNQVSSATFDVDLTTVTADGKMAPQFAISLDTPNTPHATISIAQPVPLSAAFGAGETMTATVTAQLQLRGTTHPVTLTMSGRRDGSALQVAGSVPVSFEDWGIPDPTGYGWLASVADHAVAEFYLVLDHG